MKENDPYCGYACGSAKEDQQRIIDELIDFSRQDPEYAVIMLGKLMEMLYEARNKLAIVKQT